MAQTRLEDDQLRILAARLHEGALGPAAIPGSIIAVVDDAIVVQCGDGQLALTQVQRSGRRPVSAREFAGGRKLPGQRLG
jgi:methionyl-tRNA formyltransferase